MKGLAFAPITIRQAKAFVRQHHRHNPVIVGARLAVALEFNGELVGVGLLGNPVSRELAKDRLCAEAVRVCTSPRAPKGACSKISARLKRIWQLQGGVRFVTYNRDGESGASLRGAGLKPTAIVKGRQWNCRSRPRREIETADKIRWEEQMSQVPT